MPEVSRETIAAIANSRLRNSIHNLALGTMPVAERGMVRKASLDTSVSRGCSKNRAIKGAHKNNTTYMEHPARILNQATAL